MLCNELVFDVLSSLIGVVLDSLLFLFVLVEVLEKLADDLLHEILSVHSLGILIHDID